MQWIQAGLLELLRPDAIEKLLKNGHLLVAHGRRKEVFLLSEVLWELYQTLPKNRHPYFIGLFLGELKTSAFEPSLHSLPILNSLVKDENVIRVTEAGEQHYLYGRDLEQHHLSSVPSTEQPGNSLVVVNSKGDGLGYGTLAIDKIGKVIIRNRIDLGWYLRRGK